MGLLQRIGHALGFASHEAISLRRFESAKTDRTNREQWRDAKEKPINDDLQDLPTIRGRCTKEYHRNGIVQGVVKTHAIDIVGKCGPTLQVQSDDPNYDRALEAGWNAWWAMPDAAEKWPGVELLRLWVKSLWKKGEFIIQKVTDHGAPGPVKLRLNTIDSRRLRSPFGLVGNERIFMGIEVDANGKALRYHFEDYLPNEIGAMSIATKTYPAKDILHFFELDEAGQLRGIPWLSPSLQPTADLRDYDTEVLDAARTANDFAVSLYTDHPESQYLEVNESVDIERRTISTLPPGWKPFTVTPPQPTTTYVDFRAERQREVGRPVGMPLMKIRLDASKHNYSSARFDGQGYQSGIGALEGSIERMILNALVMEVARELELADGEARLPKRPKNVKLIWTWPPQPHVDPEKEAAGLAIQLNETKTISFGEACAMLGRDPERVLEDIERWTKAFTEKGLVPPWAPPAGEANESENRAVTRAMIKRYIEDALDARQSEGWRS